MTAVFLYGALTLAAPRAAVLGRATDPAAATLPGHDLQWTGDDALPWLVPAGGAAVAGLLLEATAEDLDRLARFAGGAAPRPVTLAGGRGALAYAQPVAGRGAGPAQPWRAGDWAPRWAATVAGAAAD
uniref:gamma-glutamylcyclotransferase family protein n=1 Tax=Frigidibacter oleivorans TaxID=2487129 RepID=UPI0013DEC672